MPGASLEDLFASAAEYAHSNSPVNIVQLAAQAGAKVMLGDFEGDALQSILLVFEGGRAEILVNSQLSREAQRFAIAKELAHIAKPRPEEERATDARKIIDEIEKKIAEPDNERDAEFVEIAAKLLIPDEAAPIVELFRGDIEAMAKFFRVPEYVAQLRSQLHQKSQRAESATN